MLVDEVLAGAPIDPEDPPEEEDSKPMEVDANSEMVYSDVYECKVTRLKGEARVRGARVMQGEAHPTHVMGTMQATKLLIPVYRFPLARLLLP